MQDTSSKTHYICTYMSITVSKLITLVIRWLSMRPLILLYPLVMETSPIQLTTLISNGHLWTKSWMPPESQDIIILLAWHHNTMPNSSLPLI